MRLLALAPVLCFYGCNEYGLNGSEKVVEGPQDTAPPPVEDEEPVAEPEAMLDTWDLSEVPVDMLFFGDTSGSMAEELATMGEKISELISGLAAYTDEWQLLAVTGPSGCGVGGILTPETVDYETLFATGLATPPGEDDVDEWGLNNVAQAVDLTEEGDCNYGFLREGARLHIVFLSDEDDNSPGWDGGDPDYWIPYVDRVLAHKENPTDVRFSGIIGPVPDGCTGAEPGVGYADAIEATGGALLSICDTWYADIDELVDISVQTSNFVLSKTPDPDSIAVVVNEVPVALGWGYDAATNSIVFNADIPKTYDRVAVAYEVAEEE